MGLMSQVAGHSTAMRASRENAPEDAMRHDCELHGSFLQSYLGGSEQIYALEVLRSAAVGRSRNSAQRLALMHAPHSTVACMTIADDAGVPSMRSIVYNEPRNAKAKATFDPVATEQPQAEEVCWNSRGSTMDMNNVQPVCLRWQRQAMCSGGSWPYNAAVLWVRPV